MRPVARAKQEQRSSLVWIRKTRPRGENPGAASRAALHAWRLRGDYASTGASADSSAFSAFSAFDRAVLVAGASGSGPNSTSSYR
jgi:hypothetical protein